MHRAIAVGLLGALCAAPVLAQPPPRIVCWTDDQGRRACGDRVPPQYTKVERQFLDARGRVVETRPRELSAAEVAERERAEAARLAQERREREQAAYDRFLLQSYTQVDDLRRARDERMATVEGRLALTQRNAAVTQQAVDDLRRRSAQTPSESVLAQQLREQEQALDDQRKAIRTLHQERHSLCETWARDIRRFEQLKGLPASPPPACPPVSP